ncbi:hypothetical protein SEUCBS139899_006160 [Sporothrix eucalyptigena]|uniref:Glycine-rich cell wall structural protein 1 n=1 Tax=Sporothrix eucalyptigena TaxID=1812306 RepID=A0ABP0AQN4_9PEZI
MDTINNMASAAAQAVWPNNKTGTAHVENNSNANYDDNAGYNNNTSNINDTTATPSTSTTNTATNNLPSSTTGTNDFPGSMTTTDFNPNSAVNTAKTTSNTGVPDYSSEPISGVMGDTSKGEPYDAGNKDEQDAANARFSESQSSISGAGAATGSAADTGAATATGAAASAGAAAGAGADNIDSRKTEETKNVAGSENPAGTSEAAGAAGMKNSTVPSSSGTQEPNLDGPGPRPIQQVAMEHGGDAGRAHSDELSKGGSSNSNAIADDEDGDKPQTASHGDGTGEKYIRSTGLQADGGDFDAAREGAGREADRILEEKGINLGDNQPGAAATEDNSNIQGSNGSGSEKKKVSLGEKIKNKIRRSS